MKNIPGPDSVLKYQRYYSTDFRWAVLMLDAGAATGYLVMNGPQLSNPTLIYDVLSGSWERAFEVC